MTAGTWAGEVEGAVVSLRPATGADRGFLLRVYGATRADELALVDWTDEQKQAFVAMQFSAQDTHYRSHYANASFDVVLVDGEAAGRLYVDRGADDIRVIDIALLPDRRGAGIGSLLLRQLLDEAAATARKVSIHVEVDNRARRLYDRLGFVPVADRGLHLLMEWVPDGAAGPVPHEPAKRG